MKFLSDKARLIIDKLTRLAAGDNLLVHTALRKFCSDSERPGKLPDVVKYIKDARQKVAWERPIGGCDDTRCKNSGAGK